MVGTRKEEMAGRKMHCGGRKEGRAGRKMDFGGRKEGMAGGKCTVVVGRRGWREENALWW